MHPIATYRAAKGLVKDVAAGTKKFMQEHTQTLESEAPKTDHYQILADALEMNHYDDWYVALITAAMSESRDPAEVVAIADAAFKANPKDKSQPQEDDADVLFSGEGE
jgi:hypothetical protein